MIYLIYLFFIALTRHLIAQGCCGGANTFLGGMERGGLPAGSLTLAAVYNYTSMERTLNGSQAVVDPYGRTANAHALNIELELAPADRWSVLVVIPYADKKRSLQFTAANNVITEQYHANGIGDAFALLKFSLVPPSLHRAWSISLGAGAKAPTGTYRTSNNGLELPLDVQPGNSAWETLLWALGSYRWEEPQLNAALSLLIRMPGTNINGRLIGTDVQTLLAFSTSEFDLPLIPLLLLRGRWTDSDSQQGRRMPATGTARLELLPSVVVTALAPFNVRLGAQLPLYEYTNGIQLVPSWGIYAELRTTLALW